MVNIKTDFLECTIITLASYNDFSKILKWQNKKSRRFALEIFFILNKKYFRETSLDLINYFFQSSKQYDEQRKIANYRLQNFLRKFKFNYHYYYFPQGQKTPNLLSNFYLNTKAVQYLFLIAGI